MPVLPMRTHIEPPSPSSDSGKSDTSSARRRWRAVIASLPPVLPSQQQVMQQMLQDSGYASNRVIDPDWLVNRAWNCLVVCILLFNAITVPFRISFMPSKSLDALWVAGLACDGLLALDAILTLNRGYHDQGHKEMSRTAIRRRYACTLIATTHTTFAVQVFSIAPMDLLELSGGALYLRGALRINRLLLTPRVFRLLRELGEIHFGRHLVMLLRLGTLFALLVHSIACLWCARSPLPRTFATRGGPASYHSPHHMHPRPSAAVAHAAPPAPIPSPSLHCRCGRAGIWSACATASAPTAGCRRSGSLRDTRQWVCATSSASIGPSG